MKSLSLREIKVRIFYSLGFKGRQPDWAKSINILLEQMTLEKAKIDSIRKNMKSLTIQENESFSLELPLIPRIKNMDSFKMLHSYFMNQFIKIRENIDKLLMNFEGQFSELDFKELIEYCSVNSTIVHITSNQLEKAKSKSSLLNYIL